MRGENSHSLGSVVDPGEAVVETNAWERFGIKRANDDVPVAFGSHDACRLGTDVLQLDLDSEIMESTKNMGVDLQGRV